MSSFIQFLDKSTGIAVPLNSVDEAVCAHFKVVVAKETWYKDWYNDLGFYWAIDLRGIDVRDAVRTTWGSKNDRMKFLLEVVDVIEKTYDLRSWTE